MRLAVVRAATHHRGQHQMFGQPHRFVTQVLGSDRQIPPQPGMHTAEWDAELHLADATRAPYAAPRATGNVPAMTAPKSLRELFEQLGLRVVDSAEGTLAMEMPVDERTTNTAGGLQGGLIATMADVAAGQLASVATPFGFGIATTDLFIRYLRPIKIGPARAVAKILRTGKRSVVVQVDIFRVDDGELAATATVNFAAV